MLSLINELFRSYDFESTSIDGGSLFFLSKSNKRIAFWLVIQETNIDSLLQNQAELFNACKIVCHDDEFDKNVSMLILWDTGGKLVIDEMKKKIINIEENPFLFKKYVLYYSQAEYEDLNNQIKGAHFIDFLNAQIISSETFSYYKENSTGQNWQSLLYRISIKMPFININVKASQGLSSLTENNKKELENANLLHVNNKLFDILNTTEINNIKPIELFERLLPAFGDKANGN